MKKFKQSNAPRVHVDSIESAIETFAKTSPRVVATDDAFGFRADSDGVTQYDPVAADAVIRMRRRDATVLADALVKHKRFDATDVLFAARQLEHVIAELYVPEKSPLLWGQGVIRSSSIPRGATSFTQYAIDGTGQFEWAASLAGSSAPVVDLSGGAKTKTVHEARLKALWDVRQIESMDFAGLNGMRESLKVVRRAADEMHGRVLCSGKAELGLEGIFGIEKAKRSQSPNNGSGSSRFWSTKSTANIIADLRTLVDANEIAALGAVMFDTIILPPTTMAFLSTQPYDTASGQSTVLSYLKEAFPALKWVKAYEAASTWINPVYSNGFATVIDSRFVEYKSQIDFEQGSMREADYGVEIPFRLATGGVFTMNPQAVAYMTDIED